MGAIYDYMQEAGEMSWTATPAINVSTKNIDPLGVSSATGTRPPPAPAEAVAAPDTTKKPGARKP